jgi:hypothetical protein
MLRSRARPHHPSLSFSVTRAAAGATALALAALLAACGGGGGGGVGAGGGGAVGGGGDTPAVGPALSFNPATVSATIDAGTSLTLNVVATVARPADFANAGTVVAVVTDTTGVILPSAQLIRDSDTQYHAVLQSAPTLAAGAYKGNFSVKLCKDAGCASQFPGSPMQLPYDFTVIPAGQATFSATSAMPLTATIQQGSAAPAATAVAIAATGRDWSASNGGAAWLKLSATSGTGNATLNVSYDITGLALGAYNTALTVTASDGQSATLPVSLTVLPGGLVLGSNSVTFTAINGAPIPTQVVSLDTDNKITANWSVKSNAPWLSVSPTAGATPATTVLTVNPAVGALASNSYAGSLTITPQNLPVRTLPVTLNLMPATLLPSVNSVTLGGPYGREFGGAQTLKLSLNTSTNSWPWSLSNVPAWSTVSVASGTVNQAGAGTDLKAKPGLAPVGVTSQLITAKAQVNGDAVSAGVLLTINKDQHKLLPAETAVALVSTPGAGWSRLTRTIGVVDNFDTFAGMTATSDQPWLVVGVSGKNLILTADPTQLLSDTLSTATITVAASDPDASAPEPIRVALWKGSAAPAAAVAAPLPYTTVVADPLRPYAYAHNGGAYVDVYNLYNGAKVASMTGFSAHLGDMATSVNGDTLFMVDIDNSRITAVNLATRQISGQLPLAVAGSKDTRLKVIRPNGVEVLLLSDGSAYQVATLRRLASLPLGGGTLAASTDGKTVVQQDEGTGNVMQTSVSVDYAALNGGTLYAARIPKASHAGPGTAGKDIYIGAAALGDTGARIYSASGTPKQCSIINPSDLGVLGYLAVGDAAPNNIKVDIYGRIYCGAAAKLGVSDIFVYDTSGALLNQFRLKAGKQLLPRQMAVSGDGRVLVGITDDGALTMLPIGGP